MVVIMVLTPHNYRVRSREETMKKARERMQKYLSREQEEHHRRLIPIRQLTHLSRFGRLQGEGRRWPYMFNNVQ